MKDIIAKLQNVIFSVTGRQVTFERNKNFHTDLGIDSLTMVELVLATEEAFGISFCPSDLCEENLQDTSSYLRLLEKEYAKTASPL